MNERIVCKCGKGYASNFDKLCKFCRESKYCRTRRECSIMDIKRGEGLSLFKLEEAIKRPEANYLYQQRKN